MLTLSQAYNKDTRTILLTSFWYEVFLIVFNFICTIFIANFEYVITSWEAYLSIACPQYFKKVTESILICNRTHGKKNFVTSADNLFKKI